MERSLLVLALSGSCICSNNWRCKIDPGFKLVRVALLFRMSFHSASTARRVMLGGAAKGQDSLDGIFISVTPSIGGSYVLIDLSNGLGPFC